MLSLETILWRLSLALLLGGIIGLEREYRDKSAGFRTLILISLGSCLFTLVSIMLSNGTTDRIASNIVTGIGFIGAGVIFKNDKGVNGLTTAASVWAVAAIGMACGSGLYSVSIITCIAIAIVLFAFHPVELVIDRANRERIYKIVTPYEQEVLIKYENMMKECKLHIRPGKRTRIGKNIHLEWKVKGSRAAHDAFVSKILEDETVAEFEF